MTELKTAALAPKIAAAPAAAPVAETPAPVKPPKVEKLDKEVAKRRAEVLAPAEPDSGAVVEILMTPEERLRELIALAEEMELFHVQRLSR